MPISELLFTTTDRLLEDLSSDDDPDMMLLEVSRDLFEDWEQQNGIPARLVACLSGLEEVISAGSDDRIDMIRDWIETSYFVQDMNYIRAASHLCHKSSPMSTRATADGLKFLEALSMFILQSFDLFYDTDRPNTSIAAVASHLNQYLAQRESMIDLINFDYVISRYPVYSKMLIEELEKKVVKKKPRLKKRMDLIFADIT